VDVCVLGRIGYDLYALEHGRPLAEVERFSRHLGGSSANIAVGLARLGHDVGIISSVGADALADYLLAFLKAEKVDTRFVRLVAGYNTSLCLTEVSPPDRFPQVFYRREPADTRVEVGKYISDRVYLSYAHVFAAPDGANQNEAHVEYRLTRRWMVESVFGDAGVGGVDALWTYRY